MDKLRLEGINKAEYTGNNILNKTMTIFNNLFLLYFQVFSSYCRQEVFCISFDVFLEFHASSMTCVLYVGQVCGTVGMYLVSSAVDAIKENVLTKIQNAQLLLFCEIIFITVFIAFLLYRTVLYM